jgi:hypothetical protein
MIAKLRTSQTTSLVDPLIAESPKIVPVDYQRADFASETAAEISRRRMRNRFILANAIVWLVIILAVRLIFF